MDTEYGNFELDKKKTLKVILSSVKKFEKNLLKEEVTFFNKILNSLVYQDLLH